jgi:hypothetical protein
VVDRASARLTPATNRQQRQWFLDPTASGLDHHEICTAFFKAFARQIITLLHPPRRGNRWRMKKAMKFKGVQREKA